MLSNYISWIVFGAVTGWIISQIFPSRRIYESVSNVFIGIAGAFLTGLSLQTFMGAALEGFNVAILIVTILTTVFILATIRNFVRN